MPRRGLDSASESPRPGSLHLARVFTIGQWARAPPSSSATDPERAVAGADCVVTDAWVSMGDEDAVKRHNLLRAYQVNERLMSRAAKRRDLHALPACASRRGG